jgi:3-hydroxyisobutyrate dehydrogenase
MEEIRQSMDMKTPFERTAFIGLGMMGYPMAGRLASSGCPLHVFDLKSAALERFVNEYSGVRYSSAREASEDASIVITMLPSSDEVYATLLGPDDSQGIVSVLKPGSMVIDMSSSAPLRTRKLAHILDKHRITLVDAPVSGGLKRAQEGTLSIMFGGHEESLKRCRKTLETLGSAIFHTGSVGTGHAMKALNNYISAAGLVAVVEALHAGEKFGLDPKTMTAILNASTGKNNTTENKVLQYMLSGDFNSGFSLQLMVKDLGLAVQLADDLDVSAPLAHTCYAIWRTAADAQQDKSLDHTELYRLLDR